MTVCWHFPFGHCDSLTRGERVRREGWELRSRICVSRFVCLCKHNVVECFVLVQRGGLSGIVHIFSVHDWAVFNDIVACLDILLRRRRTRLSQGLARSILSTCPAFRRSRVYDFCLFPSSKVLACGAHILCRVENNFLCKHCTKGRFPYCQLPTVEIDLPNPVVAGAKKTY